MNSNVIPSVIQIEKENLRKLVTEVRETFATDLNIQHKIQPQKTFGIVDLWNCQRTMKTATSRRRY